MNKHFGVRTMGFGLYCYDMIPDERSGFQIAGIRYGIKWDIRPESIADMDRKLKLKMLDEAVITGNEFLKKYGKPPELIRVNSTNLSDLVYSHAE